MSGGTLDLWLSSVRFVGAMTVVCGLVYPLLTTGIGRALFPDQATGSLIEVDGRVVGSRLVGQPFAAETYLHGRPSACGHDPRALAGSNLAPSNPALRDRVRRDVDGLIAREGVAAGDVPPELVAASGSGIDPHVTPRSAALQVPRIAAARGIEPSAVERVLAEATRGGGQFDLGPAHVDVLAVNLALDALPVDAR